MLDWFTYIFHSNAMKINAKSQSQSKIRNCSDYPLGSLGLVTLTFKYFLFNYNQMCGNKQPDMLFEALLVTLIPVAFSGGGDSKLTHC